METLSNNEILFIQESLKQGLRVDGRGLFEVRKLSINFMQKRGHVEVSLGDSLVFCATEVTIDSPFPDRPNEGFLTFNVNYLPMAHPGFESVIGSNLSQRGRRFRNEISQELERLLEKTIKKSRALNPESLCIVSGKFAWHVTVNMHILADHGNLNDLIVQACVLSLLHARIPDIKINPDKTIEALNVWKPLSLHFLPICVSFGFCDGIAFLDPDSKEESVIDSRVVACVNVYGDVLAFQKAGAAGVEQETIFQCLDVAIVKAKEITKLLRDVVAGCMEFDVKVEKVETRTQSVLKDIDMI